MFWADIANFNSWKWSVSFLISQGHNKLHHQYITRVYANLLALTYEMGPVVLVRQNQLCLYDGMVGHCP